MPRVALHMLYPVVYDTFLPLESFLSVWRVHGVERCKVRKMVGLLRILLMGGTKRTERDCQVPLAARCQDVYTAKYRAFVLVVPVKFWRTIPVCVCESHAYYGIQRGVRKELVNVNVSLSATHHGRKCVSY